VEAVVAELLGAAYESQAQSPIVITVWERVLHAFTLGFGSRRISDGTIDLWAEVPRARPGNS
jgi:hypothetical protein